MSAEWLPRRDQLEKQKKSRDTLEGNNEHQVVQRLVRHAHTLTRATVKEHRSTEAVAKKPTASSVAPPNQVQAMRCRKRTPLARGCLFSFDIGLFDLVHEPLVLC